MPARNFTDEEEMEIGKIYRSGISARAIARAYGLSHHISITAALGRQGVKQRSPAARNRLYSLDPHKFDVIDTEEKAYWWGFIYADGHVSRRTLTVKLAAKDKQQLVKLRDFLESEAPIKELMGNCGNGKKYKQAGIDVTDRHLAKRLKDLGVVSYRPHHERIARNLPDDLFWPWLRGYSDGDGSITAGKRPRISLVGQEKLLRWIRHELHARVDTREDGYLYAHTKTNKVHYLEYTGRKQCLMIGRRMYDDAGPYMQRKKDRFEQLKKRPLAAGSLLTPKKVIDMRQLYETGKYTHAQLGEMFGVSESTAGAAIRGTHNWTYVE